MIEPAAGGNSTGRDTRIAGTFRRLRIAAVVALTVGTLGIGVVPTVAAYGNPVACGTPSTKASFARFGDTNNYFLVSNGGFESGATDWSLSGGATVVAGNESYYANSGSDWHSLQIPAGATAESRTICVSRTQNIIRLFANNLRVTGAILHVEAWAQNPSNGQWAVTAFDVNGNANAAGWSPTMQLQMPNMFGGTGTQNMFFRLTTRGAAATWYVDDLYVDPVKNW